MTKTLLNEISKTLPKDVEGIKRLCGDSIPPLVEENIEDIKNLVLKAIEDEPDTTTIVNPSKRDCGIKNQDKRDKRQRQGDACGSSGGYGVSIGQGFSHGGGYMSPQMNGLGRMGGPNLLENMRRVET